jgi:mitofusin
MAKVLADKLLGSLSHLDRLKQRICDKNSKILVTGDVNGGKSTLVNALLGAPILPMDQQPCTQSFCEVVPRIDLEIPIVQAMKDVEAYYSAPNGKGCLEMTVEEMQDYIQEEASDFSWYRLLWPVKPGKSRRFTAGPALDVSLIDSPGLNSDLFKTTSLFSRQADIDVVIFVINAANHLTLSAREFLERAAKEKEHIFVVVNKFDDIKNQDKCRRIILQQICEVLPQTFQESNLLVHFVSAGPYLTGNPTSCQVESFERLESCLREFIFENRIKSKLNPVQTYLARLVTDLICIIGDNCNRIKQEAEQLRIDLDMISPCYDQLVAHDSSFKASLQETINETCQLVYQDYRSALLGALLAERICQSVPWAGLLGLFSFRKTVLGRAQADLLATVELSKSRSIETTLSGLYKLNVVAYSHASQVFSKEPISSSRDEMLSRFSESQKVIIGLPELAPWDLIDFGDELISNKTWIGATSIGAAFFGYRPLMSLGMRFVELILPRRLSRWNFALLVGGALTAGIILIDIEQMVRRRLIGHIKECFAKGTLSQDYARSIEGITRDIMMQTSVRLVSRFDEALNQQRRLRGQKDLERRQCETVLAHFSKHREAIQRIRRELES